MIYTTTSLTETEPIAQGIATTILSGESPRLVLLRGNLGGGKTTFSQALGKALGVTQDITSPTFVILKSYPIPDQKKTLHHLDLYRIEKSWELEELGLPAIIEDPETVILVEWPDKTADFWTNIPHTLIEFEVVNETTRTLTIHHNL